MRRAVFVAHQYLGLTLGLVLAVICVSGSMLVVAENGISGYRDYPMQRVAVRSAHVSLEVLVERVERAYPRTAISQILFSCTPNCTYAASLDEPAGKRLDVLVDPYTGAIVKSAVWEDSLAGKLFALHAELLMGERGALLCAYCGIAFSLLALTGLLLWPGWRNAVAGFRMRLRSGTRRFHFDVHKVTGIIAVVFLVVVALTGAGRVLLPAPLPAASAPHVAEHRRALSLDALVAKANGALAGRLIAIWLPAHPGDPLTVRKAVPGDADPYGFSFVTIDPYTGRITSVFDIAKEPLRSRIYTWLYPLHIGSLGGAPLRWVYAILGLAPVVLFYSGFALWLDQLRRAAKDRRPRRTP
jgi:uncharacterized iron-regulated membrane protein